jgi:hypothetical protein
MENNKGKRGRPCTGIQDAVLDALKIERATPTMIAQRLNKTAAAINSVLYRLRQMDKVRTVAFGLYEINE